MSRRQIQGQKAAEWLLRTGGRGRVRSDGWWVGGSFGERADVLELDCGDDGTIFKCVLSATNLYALK